MGWRFQTRAVRSPELEISIWLLCQLVLGCDCPSSESMTPALSAWNQSSIVTEVVCWNALARLGVSR